MLEQVLCQGRISYRRITRKCIQEDKFQVPRAKLARTLFRRLAFGTPAVVARMLNQGALIECPMTSDDIVTADKIYCQFVPELRGLDTISVEPSSPRVQMRLIMYTDIMFVNSKPFLLHVFQPIVNSKPFLLHVFQPINLRGSAICAGAMNYQTYERDEILTYTMVISISSLEVT